MSARSIASNSASERVVLPPPPSAITAQSKAGGPKLRVSCNYCGTAKVKCDRRHPQCGRCTTLGLSCVYGLSRKFGRRSRNRPAVSLNASTEESTRSPWITENQTNTSLRISESIEIPSFSELMAHDFPFGINTALGIDERNQLNPSFTSLFPPDEWNQPGSSGPGLDISPSSALEAESALDIGSRSQESHSCPRESYEIFRDLICPSASLHAPESNSFAVWVPFDQVLHFNRNAVDRLSMLLKCSCAKSGHRAMVHASIVSRILIWYQQAAGWADGRSREPQPFMLPDSSTISYHVSPFSLSSSPLPSGTAVSTSDTTSPSLVQATGFAVECAPVSIGSFSTQDQNVQAAFRSQLVLSELKKTATLIDIFSSRDSDESAASNAAGLYSYLGTWLRSEYSRTVTALRSRLSKLDENLES